MQCITYNLKILFCGRFALTVCREFNNNSKSFKEIMREIILIYLSEKYCNFDEIEVKSKKSGIGNQLLTRERRGIC